VYVKETSNNLSSQPLTSDNVPVVVDKLIDFVTNNGTMTDIVDLVTFVIIYIVTQSISCASVMLISEDCFQ